MIADRQPTILLSQENKEFKSLLCKIWATTQIFFLYHSFPS